MCQRPWVPEHGIKMVKRHLLEMWRVSQTESGAGEVTLGPQSYSEWHWHMTGRNEG